MLGAGNLVATAWRSREKLHFLNLVPLQDIYGQWIAKFERPRLRALDGLKQRLEKPNGSINFCMCNLHPHHAREVMVSAD